MHIDGANPIGRRLFRIICRFVVNRQGVWSTCAFFFKLVLVNEGVNLKQKKKNGEYS